MKVKTLFAIAAISMMSASIAYADGNTNGASMSGTNQAMSGTNPAGPGGPGAMENSGSNTGDATSNGMTNGNTNNNSSSPSADTATGDDDY